MLECWTAHIDDQRRPSITVMVRCLSPGQFPHAGSGSCSSSVDRGHGVFAFIGESADESRDRRIRRHRPVEIGPVAEDGTIGECVTAESQSDGNVDEVTLAVSWVAKGFFHAVMASFRCWPSLLGCTVSASSSPPVGRPYSRNPEAK